ncbi:hypothetical protein IQ241_06350 [Romeria aff. gracilis LEGE 07310]|uniref:Uncharacterized protein n=2 Tax=Vasconcelosia TaxID=3366328 RepID=A0A8J7AG60_9CYAN|nr:hypothetical protein [Romeria aff. gracilis LEGE 07310]
MVIFNLIFKILTTAAYLAGLLGLLGVLLWSAVRTLRAGWQYCQQLHQVPCHRCAYFTGDYRLKCTVRPCAALTKDAVDCLDYAPKSPTALPVQLPAKRPQRRATQGLLMR